MPSSATASSDTVESLPVNDNLVSVENPDRNQSALNTDNSVVGDPVDELNYQIRAASEELAALKGQLAEDEAKKTQIKELQEELQKQYIENPYYKAIMQSSLSIQYEDLFKKLNLPSEKNDELKDVLLEERMAMREMNMAYSDIEDLTPEQLEERSKQYQEIQEETDEKIKELIGENNYETYNFYIETQYLRYQVSDYSGYLDSDNALSESQKESLIEAMNEEINSIVYDKIETDGESGGDYNDENHIEIRTTNQEKRYDAYLNAANGILSSSQLEAFEEYIDNEREQYKTMMEMSALQYAITDAQNIADEDDD